MTFLKKLGSILVQAGAVITGFKPFFPMLPKGDQITSIVDKLTNPLTQIAETVVLVEAVGQSLKIAGPDKLKAASPIVANIVLKSDLLIGKKIKNQDLFRVSVEQLTTGIVGILNSVDEKEVQEEKVVTQ